MRYLFSVINQRSNNLMSLFIENTKDKIKETEKYGIHQIQCGNCEKCYTMSN